MPRINIEDRWFNDYRRMKLCEQLGSFRLADGLMLEVWKLSQQFWLNGKKLVPARVFEQIKDHELLYEFDLAVKRRSFVYVRGTKQHFGWFFTKITNGAKGGKSKAKKSSERLANPSESYPLTLTLAPAPAPAPALKTNTQNVFDYEILIKEWGNTLKHYGIARDPKFDEYQIYFLSERYGTERLLDALRGFRFENKNTDYDPARNCTISRLTNPASFERLETIGSANRPVHTKTHEVGNVEF